MRKVLNFLKQNIVGVGAGVVLALVVWKMTGFNLWLLLFGFTGGYYAIGIPVELLVLYLEDSSVRRPPRTKRVKPDSKAGFELASSGTVSFITSRDMLSPSAKAQTEDEKNANAENGGGNEVSNV